MLLEKFVRETIEVQASGRTTSAWNTLESKISRHPSMVREVDTWVNVGGKAQRRRTNAGIKIEFVDTIDEAEYIGSQSHNYDRHTARVPMIDGQVNKGVLAEELMHALDSQSGMWKQLQQLRDAKHAKNCVDDVNKWWHVGVFRRLAAQLSQNPKSVFGEFLTADDALKFKQAADELDATLPAELQGKWNDLGLPVK